MAGTPNTGAAAAPQSNSQQQNGAQLPKPTINFDSRLAGQKLRYPYDLKTPKYNQSFLRFKSYDFSTIQSSNDVYNLGFVGNAIGGTLSDLASYGTSTTVEKLAYSNDTIDLYVPPGISPVSYSANWGEASLGGVGAQRSGEGANDLLSNITRGFGNFLGSATQEGIRASLDQIAGTMNKIPSFNASGTDIFGLATGLVFNENKFSIFNNINLRTFNYSFILVARSKNEKEEINQIINTFKIALHPAGLTIGSSGTYTPTGGGETKSFSSVARPPVLKFPKLWTIEYRIGNNMNKYMPRTKFCALQNVSINYTPNSVFTTLTDGQVPAIQIDLSFKELTALTVDQIKNGEILNSGDNNGFKGFVDTGINDDYSFKNGGTF